MLSKSTRNDIDAALFESMQGLEKQPGRLHDWMIIGGVCFFQILAHFDLAVFSKLRWLGTFNSHNEISQHQYDFLTV